MNVVAELAAAVVEAAASKLQLTRANRNHK